MADTAPLVKTIEVDTDAVAAASDGSFPIGVAPFAGTVTGVSFIPRSTLTGANTESRTIAVINKGQSGAGSTSVASKAFTSGVNAPANDETAITLSGTPANLTVAAGDELAATSTHVGSTGLADPGGKIIVTISRG